MTLLQPIDSSSFTETKTQSPGQTNRLNFPYIGASSFEHVPRELQVEILMRWQSSIIPMELSKTWSKRQKTYLPEVWEQLEKAKDTSPLLTAYLREIRENDSVEKKFKALYSQMIGDAKSMNRGNNWFRIKSTTIPELQLPVNFNDRVFDPKMYLELAQEIENVSLQRMWPYVYSQLSTLPLLFLPPPNAPIEEIRMWMNDPINQTRLPNTLTLDNINLGTLPQELKLFTGLQNLFCESSNLFILPDGLIDSCTQLADVDLSHNKLRTIPERFFEYSTQLNTVDLNRNLLQKIPRNLFPNCPLLRVANFSYNRIQRVPGNLFQNCPALAFASFSGNDISRVPGNLFQNSPLLLIAHFSSNKISKIAQNTFQNCNLLRWTYFDDNKIKKIPENLFENCTPLESVTFKNNLLPMIPENLFQNCPNLDRSDFYSNLVGLTCPPRLYRNCPKMKRGARQFQRFIDHQFELLIHRLSQLFF